MWRREREGKEDAVVAGSMMGWAWKWRGGEYGSLWLLEKGGMGRGVGRGKGAWSLQKVWGENDDGVGCVAYSHSLEEAISTEDELVTDRLSLHMEQSLGKVYQSASLHSLSPRSLPRLGYPPL